MARDASEEESLRASTPSQWRGSVRNATVGGTGSPDPVSTHRDFSSKVRRGLGWPRDSGTHCGSRVPMRSPLDWSGLGRRARDL